MAADVAAIVLPPILTIVQLRRTLSDDVQVLRTMQRINANIFSYRILTVELKMSKKQTKKYWLGHRVHAKHFSKIFAENDVDNTKTKKMNQIAHRNLCQLTVDQKLLKFNRKRKKTIENMQNMYEKFNDLKTIWYFQKTRSTIMELT